MIIITIGYKDFAIPDEYAKHIFKAISVMKPIKHKGHGLAKTYEYDTEGLRLEIEKVPDELLKPIQTEESPKVINLEELDNV